LRGEGEGGGEGRCPMPFLPLTLALSLKGRGEITFDNTEKNQRRIKMKTLKILIIFVLSMVFILLVGSIAWAADVKKEKAVRISYKCPQGWHIKLGSFEPNKTTICVPDKPKSINCPEGTKPFIGDCEVGCQEIPK
jgi:hypothetical protein